VIVLVRYCFVDDAEPRVDTLVSDPHPCLYQATGGLSYTMCHAVSLRIVVVPLCVCLWSLSRRLLDAGLELA
jgi:hypothetical protein